METLRRPLKDHVYDYISSRIDAGELSAGDRLSEQTICDAMGVSRTPVREALIQLASDGYLDNLPRRGFRVRGFDQQNAVEVFEIMGPLDGQAAYLSCPNLTDDDITQLKFLVGSMDLAIQGGLIRKYDDIQRDFHLTYFNLRQRPSARYDLAARALLYQARLRDCRPGDGVQTAQQSQQRTCPYS